LLLAAALGGCSKAGVGSDKSAAPPAEARAGGNGSPGGVGAGGGAQGGGRRAPAVQVQAYVARRGELVVERETSGVVSAAVSSQVASKVSGNVARTLRSVGDWVGEGEAVVELDTSALDIALANARTSLEAAKVNLATVLDATDQAGTRLERQLESAKASLSSAQRSYDSQKALFGLGAVSASALDAAESQLAKAKADVESARTALDQNRRGLATSANQNSEALRIAVRTAENNLRQAELNLANASIRSPFAGQIAALNVSPGMYVGQNTAVFSLVSADRVVAFGVAPADSPALPRAAPVEYRYGPATYRLRVRNEPSAPTGGLVPMVAEPVDRLDLPYGAVGAIRYRVSLAAGVIAPIAALESLEGRHYVFAVEEGKAAIRDVTILAESGAEVALSGIGDGTTLVLDAPPGLLAGSAVQASVRNGAAGGKEGSAGREGAGRGPGKP